MKAKTILADGLSVTVAEAAALAAGLKSRDVLLPSGIGRAALPMNDEATSLVFMYFYKARNMNILRSST